VERSNRIEHILFESRWHGERKIARAPCEFKKLRLHILGERDVHPLNRSVRTVPVVRRAREHQFHIGGPVVEPERAGTNRMLEQLRAVGSRRFAGDHESVRHREHREHRRKRLRHPKDEHRITLRCQSVNSRRSLAPLDSVVKRIGAGNATVEHPPAGRLRSGITDPFERELHIRCCHAPPLFRGKAAIVMKTNIRAQREAILRSAAAESKSRGDRGNNLSRSIEPHKPVEELLADDTRRHASHLGRIQRRQSA
jgi:hypothetical protein